MNQLILRNTRDIKNFNEDDWTMFGWQYRLTQQGAEARHKVGNAKDGNESDTVIGVAYVGVLVAFMLAYLT